MSVILDQIQKASHWLDFDLKNQIQALQDKQPIDLITPQQQAQRQQFLTRSLGDEHLAVDVLERVLAGNELQSVNYLERGAVAARAVTRIQIRQPNGSAYGWGSGFLIAPQVLITNHHVLPDAGWATRSEAHFEYEETIAGEPIGPTIFQLDPQALFYSSKDLDFTVVAVASHSRDRQRVLSDFGYLPLLETPGKSVEGEWLTIIQHPNGERKQVCVRENRLLKRTDNVLWYTTDTVGGSSGSPVYNNDWFVVALHHSGVPETRNGKIQTLNGQDFDPHTMDESQIKWLANEGIRASRIVQTLKPALSTHPLLQPLFSATPASARVDSPLSSKALQPTPQATPTLSPRERNLTTMSQDHLQTVSIPLQITLQISTAPGANGVHGVSVEAAHTAAGREAAAVDSLRQPSPVGDRRANFEVAFDSNYITRKGYNPDFLGEKYRVGLPKLSPALLSQATKLINPEDGNDSNDYVLKYHNYSVVMHKQRRFAIYSAANVSFGGRFDMNRPRDVWRLDPRIPAAAQVGESYYVRNKFDRGHLTRREDLEFGGTPQLALASAGDTMHFTNCMPQQERFNQGKELWQGIERHVLETAIVAGNFNAQIITGPVFNDGDPEYRNIQYPLQYWKVVVALTDQGNLFATAYLASQAETIAQFGIEEADVPFSPYKTFQVKISEIERLTGLRFVYGEKNTKSLSDVDPLETSKPRRRRRFSATESTLATIIPPGYVELNDLDDIVT